MGAGKGAARRVQAKATANLPYVVKGGLGGNDLQYGSVYYDYETGSDYDYHEQHCDGICRCSTIENFHITSFSAQGLAEQWSLESVRPPGKKGRMPALKMDMIDQYGIERIIQSEHLTTDDFEADIRHSYYGEEVFGVQLEAGKAQNIDLAVAELFQKKDLQEKTEFLLEKEYGYLLPALQGKTYQVKEVPIAKVQFGASNTYARIDPELVEKYRADIDNIQVFGVALENSQGEYQLVDGIHRFNAAQREKKLRLPLIVAS